MRTFNNLSDADGAKYATYLFFILFAAFIVFAVLKKIYFYFRFRVTYNIFPKLNNKGIASISLTIAISSSIILLLTLLTSGIMGVFFRVYPSWRITIEGILIKIGGVCFGPIIGVFIALITDLLTIALTSGMFHFGYFISALYLGFGCGLIRSVFNIFKKHRIETMLVETTILSLVIATCVTFYILNLQNIYTSITHNYLDITFLGKSIHLSFTEAIIINDGTVGLLILAIWTCYLISYRNKIKLLFVKFKNSDIRRTYSSFQRSFKTGKDLNKKIMSFLFWS